MVILVIKNKLKESGSGIDFARSKLTSIRWKNRGYFKLTEIDSIIIILKLYYGQRWDKWM